MERALNNATMEAFQAHKKNATLRQHHQLVIHTEIVFRLMENVNLDVPKDIL